MLSTNMLSSIYLRKVDLSFESRDTQDEKLSVNRLFLYRIYIWQGDWFQTLEMAGVIYLIAS